jgi:hypothetical protein
MQVEPTVLGKSEVFWVAVQAAFAVAGFFVILMYTLYTRKMMRLQEESRRSELKPVFSVREQMISHELRSDPSGGYDFRGQKFIERYRLILGIRNIGKGPAVLLHGWHQPVSDAFDLGNTTIFDQPGSAGFASVHDPSEDLEALGDGVQRTLMELLPNETRQLYVRDFDPNSRWLFIVEGADIAGGRHQLQVLREAGEDNPATRWKMSSAMGDSFGEKILRFTRRVAEIQQAVDTELDRYNVD